MLRAGEKIGVDSAARAWRTKGSDHAPRILERIEVRPAPTLVIPAPIADEPSVVEEIETIPATTRIVSRPVIDQDGRRVGVFVAGAEVAFRPDTEEFQLTTPEQTVTRRKIVATAKVLPAVGPAIAPDEPTDEETARHHAAAIYLEHAARTGLTLQQAHERQVAAYRKANTPGSRSRSRSRTSGGMASMLAKAEEYRRAHS
jgi:hypothetical protein